MATAMTAPEYAGSRDQARALVAGLPEDLKNSHVIMDCTALEVSTPSFLDELVKVIVVERQADLLQLLNATPRTKMLMDRAASNRDATDRVDVELRPEPRRRFLARRK